MGQAGNSNRRATLDDHKERSAGRNNERETVRQEVMPREAKGKTGGAFGADAAAAGKPKRPSRKRKG